MGEQHAPAVGRGARASNVVGSFLREAALAHVPNAFVVHTKDLVQVI
jgi:hypothetical protein